MTRLILPATANWQISEEAWATLPKECCGLLEGTRDGDAITVTALHTAWNTAEEIDRFAIDPADHFAALRKARANGREIVGCYHSHPNGRAEPSARDAEGADEEGFVWLIAAVGDAVELRAFIRGPGGFSPLEIAG